MNFAMVDLPAPRGPQTAFNPATNVLSEFVANDPVGQCQYLPDAWQRLLLGQKLNPIPFGSKLT